MNGKKIPESLVIPKVENHHVKVGAVASTDSTGWTGKIGAPGANLPTLSTL